MSVIHQDVSEFLDRFNKQGRLNILNKEVNINSENYMRIHVKRKYGLQTLLLSAYSNVKLFSNFNSNSKFHYIHFITFFFFFLLKARAI